MYFILNYGYVIETFPNLLKLLYSVSTTYGQFTFSKLAMSINTTTCLIRSNKGNNNVKSNQIINSMVKNKDNSARNSVKAHTP